MRFNFRWAKEKDCLFVCLLLLASFCVNLGNHRKVRGGGGGGGVTEVGFSSLLYTKGKTTILGHYVGGNFSFNFLLFQLEF